MNSETGPSLRDTLVYTPVPSRFGTSGVRALVRDLTDLEVYCLTLGTLRYLEDSDRLWCDGDARARRVVPLAGDLRPSTRRLLQAACRAVTDRGCSVDYTGHIPTPALTYYALVSGSGSFVVTGSHIPADRNGQKANRCDGEVLKSDEAGIVAAVEAAREEEYGRPAPESMFDAQGMLKARFRPQMPPATDAARVMYADRYRKVFAPDALHGLRVVFFQYAAVGRDLLPEILENAGAEVIRAGRSDEFVPIDTEAISDAHLEMLRQLVLTERDRHGPIDALVSTDGDSDRPLVVGVEESGDRGVSLRFYPGDLLGIVVADVLAADSVSVPISANPAVQEFFAPRGVSTRKTRIGSPYVIEAMQAEVAGGRRRVMAWEANGGFLLGSDLVLDGATLRALPTRDAALPLLCVLQAAARHGGRLAPVFEDLPKWYGKAGLLDDFPRETSLRMMEHFSTGDPRMVWIEFAGDRVALRDADEQERAAWTYEEAQGRVLLARRRELESVFTPRRGFDAIERINVQDGIRCYFRNGDIAHVRPSGNAPQLRIYAHARTQARADQIVRMGTMEPDGILRSLQRLVESR